jgi:tetratricopeptide (TPR) repeat protein
MADTSLGKLALMLLACAAGAGGGILARVVEGAPLPSRSDRSVLTAADLPLDEILDRLAALEAKAQGARTQGAPDVRGVEGARPPASAVEKGVPDATRPPAPEAPSDSAKEGDPLAAVLGRTFGYGESEALFGRLARDHGAIGDVIARLEAEIARNPRSADLHAALATAYAAKTAFFTPPGPEQGTVWEKAERAYDEAIRLDPGHWQARYGKAFGDSMAPEFVGLRPRAIRQFEELMEIQEKKPSAPEHVEVYLRLGTLLKDAGNVKRAREVWQRGLDRFAGDARLAEALALMEEK